MATKRRTASDPVVSGLPSRSKSRATHKHLSAVTVTAETSAPAAEPPARNTASEPTFEEIATLAYSYWEARGYQGGSPEEDWLRAESELRSRTAA
jgi:Protein of unknown function (DUF2934)